MHSCLRIARQMRSAETYAPFYILSLYSVNREFTLFNIVKERETVACVLKMRKTFKFGQKQH